ncbi:MAG TPA: membrane dipeptidase [Vicinamibacteria bacterium]
MTRRRGAFGVLLVLVLLLAACLLAAPALVERHYNEVVPRPRASPSARALALHRRLTIVDLHADSLLWGRDLLDRSPRGHVDVPRLVEGNVAIEAFTVVTKTPRGLNITRNDDRTDMITPLALVQRWPPRTWGSLRERALYLAGRLDAAARRSDGRLTVLRTRDDVGRYLERRRRAPETTAGVLGLEGAHALEGDLAAVDALFDAGFRMMAPTHFFDTDWAGSAHGVAKGGLTAKGRALVRRLEERRVLLDLAHASPRTIADALAMATRPVVVSHGGVKGTCPSERTLSDEHVRAIAAGGGVIGIGYWETAVCGREPRQVVAAIKHVVSLVGDDHVGLGSDYDGATTVGFDTSQLAALTQQMQGDGLSEAQIRKVLGGNVVRVLRAVLPER